MTHAGGHVKQASNVRKAALDVNADRAITWATVLSFARPQELSKNHDALRTSAAAAAAASRNES